MKAQIAALLAQTVATLKQQAVLPAELEPAL